MTTPRKSSSDAKTHENVTSRKHKTPADVQKGQTKYKTSKNLHFFQLLHSKNTAYQFHKKLISRSKTTHTKKARDQRL